MKTSNHINEYKRIMNCIDVDNSVKQQIITNCARYSTMKKIRAGKYKITAVIKEKSTENF